MFSDIGMAFVMAMLVQLPYFISKNWKDFIVVSFCIITILIYFFSGCKLNFIGEMDFSIWLVFIIIFDKIIVYFLEKSKSRVGDN